MKRLQEEGDELAGIASLPRVFLREWDQGFFNKYIHKIKKNNLLSLIIQKQYKCVNDIIAEKKSENQEKPEGEQN